MGDITVQAEQVFENLQAVVEEAGGTLEDVVSTTTYLADSAYAAEVGVVRRRYFTGQVPPTSTVVVAPMAREQFLVEVTAVAGSKLEPSATTHITSSFAVPPVVGHVDPLEQTSPSLHRNEPTALQIVPRPKSVMAAVHQGPRGDRLDLPATMLRSTRSAYAGLS